MRRVFLTVSAGLLVLLIAGTLSPLAAQTETAAEGMAAMAESTVVDTALVDTAAVDSLAAAVEEEPVEPEPAPQGGFQSGLVEFFQKGGTFMWGLLALSIIGVAVIIERWITLHKARADVRKLMERIVGALKKGRLDEALDVCASMRGPIPQILHAGLRQAKKGTVAVEKAIETAGIIEMSFLERGLIILATVANVAPLLGFLGTVSGMISAFEAIAQAEQVSAKLVASGISEALITTMSGLVIAIPTQVAHNLFVQRIDRFVVEMEDSAAELVDTLASMDE
ncbi:MAG TPA: MotA/TolQ/ExbB proton channel family protein [bacterium]|nr:MotA/TolQ/ExbB proton channel family protein [bacterium]